jgi:cytochrome P450
MRRKPGVISEDGPPHMAFRLLVQGRLMPKSLEKYRPRLTEITGELVDRMLAGGNRGDLHDQLALPLPVRTTALLLGIVDADYQELVDATEALMLFGWTLDNLDDYFAVQARLYRFFDQYIDAREQALRDAGIEEAGPEHVGTVVPDDLISDVVCGKVQGRRAERAEMQELLRSLLIGGIETTTYLITNSVWRLLEDRSRWEAVGADPERLIPIAIEESLRHDPPGLGLWRTTAKPVEVCGWSIPGDAKVQMSYGSANRDPDVFSEPNEFKLDRPMSEIRQHLTFGAGPHNCVGQHVARLEATLALQALHTRMPGLRLDGETRRVPNFGFWGRLKMPVAWQRS